MLPFSQRSSFFPPLLRRQSVSQSEITLNVPFHVYSPTVGSINGVRLWCPVCEVDATAAAAVVAVECCCYCLSLSHSFCLCVVHSLIAILAHSPETSVRRMSK